jgi:hypothetical protein
MRYSEHTGNMAAVDKISKRALRQRIDGTSICHPDRAAHTQGCKVSTEQSPVFVRMEKIRALFSHQPPKLQQAGKASQSKAPRPDSGVLQALEPHPMHRLIRLAVKYTGDAVSAPGKGSRKGCALHGSAALDRTVGVDHHYVKRQVV